MYRSYEITPPRSCGAKEVPGRLAGEHSIRGRPPAAITGRRFAVGVVLARL